MSSLARAQQRSTFTHRLHWYGKRLRVMLPSEWLYRFQQEKQIGLWAFKHYLGLNLFEFPKMNADQFLFCTSTSKELPDLSWTCPTSEETNRLLNGQIGAFSYDWNWSADPRIWHRAPDTNRLWPCNFFHHIPYREGNPYGDVRIAWEPARLQHLLPLALIVNHGPTHLQSQAIPAIETRFLSWHQANPFPIGIHYISAMECALRILAVCHTFDMVRQYIFNISRLWSALLQMIHSHAQYISHRVSQHSSSGNHTVAEGAGLTYAGILFPEFPESTNWLTQGLSVLEESATSQILPDGGGAEQSLWYLWFITDLFGLVIGLLKHHQHPIPLSICKAYSSGTTFLTTFAETPETLPLIGDSDTGYALSPYVRLHQPSTRIRTTCKQFPQSGYSLITAPQKEAARLVFDHGPLGMKPSYGHGHADALSVTLSLGKQGVLIDTGTFTYAGDPNWRRYFRGTSAHNTVVVDGMDQSIQETSFMWSQPFQCSLVLDEQLSDGSIRLLAFHNGYESRAQVIHWRGISYRPDHEWFIWDYLHGSDIHTLDLFWHVGTHAVRHGNAFEVESPNQPLWLEVVGGSLTTHQGETNPILGWKSASYGYKEPITTIRSKYCGPLPYEFITTIGPQKKSETGCEIETLLFFRRLVHEACAN